MIILLRTEAIVLSSFIEMINLNDDEVARFTESALAELEYDITDQGEIKKHLRIFIEGRFECFTNSYIAAYLSKRLSRDFEILGSMTELNPCRCCGYKTLRSRSEYDICRVCFWEDDGTVEGGRYSSVNNMNLNEAKNNFLNIGAVEARFLQYLEEDRFVQYDLYNE